ncbi:hypothetical protein BDA99DRAFT_596223 [Phascolomyces articulosus]|uniref:Uncharacterized protein n=1 Tax=Phascolomyces articulosus TaxID=60185 RepID=A0AAD5KGX6_9FUNG|nr:hypothetical protein BDA99DRAFT_596223 [Phascolomyces articulosus]
MKLGKYNKIFESIIVRICNPTSRSVGQKYAGVTLPVDDLQVSPHKEKYRKHEESIITFIYSPLDNTIVIRYQSSSGMMYKESICNYDKSDSEHDKYYYNDDARRFFGLGGFHRDITDGDLYVFVLLAVVLGIHDGDCPWSKEEDSLVPSILFRKQLAYSLLF